MPASKVPAGLVSELLVAADQPPVIPNSFRPNCARPKRIAPNRQPVASLSRYVAWGAIAKPISFHGTIVAMAVSDSLNCVTRSPPNCALVKLSKLRLYSVRPPSKFVPGGVYRIADGI